MIAMHVVSLTIDAETRVPMVILQSNDGENVLSVLVGAAESIAISLGINGTQLPRPLTHDLMHTALNALGGTIERLEIIGKIEDSYLADLCVRQGETLHRIDCRPSDGIALSLRAKAPIYVSSSIATPAKNAEYMTQFSAMNPPEDIAKEILRLDHPREKDFSTSPTTHTAEKANEDAEDASTKAEQSLAKLLRILEPDSKRRM